MNNNVHVGIVLLMDVKHQVSWPTTSDIICNISVLMRHAWHATHNHKIYLSGHLRSIECE